MIPSIKHNSNHKHLSLTVWGSCGGTEPQPGRHHSAITLECDNRIYWFDAGESCSYHAHLAHLDLPSTEAIFISHTHMDHIGGLPNLLWTLRKLSKVSDTAKCKLRDRDIPLFLPDLTFFKSLSELLRATEGGFDTVFRLTPRPCQNGIVYEQNGVRVIAQANRHLSETEPFRSYSYRIEAGGHAIVYSGDVKSIDDIKGLIPNADLVLMETGHHAPEAVCRTLKDSGMPFGELVFVHHGRAILNHPEEELAKAKAYLGNRVLMAHDGMTLTL